MFWEWRFLSHLNALFLFRSSFFVFHNFVSISVCSLLPIALSCFFYLSSDEDLILSAYCVINTSYDTTIVLKWNNHFTWMITLFFCKYQYCNIAILQILQMTIFCFFKAVFIYSHSEIFAFRFRAKILIHESNRIEKYKFLIKIFHFIQIVVINRIWMIYILRRIIWNGAFPYTQFKFFFSFSQTKFKIIDKEIKLFIIILD